MWNKNIWWRTSTFWQSRGSSAWSRARGRSAAEIRTLSSPVVQNITLINLRDASFSSPLAWTAAQNKEIESHLNSVWRAELTWNECWAAAPPVNTKQAEGARSNRWRPGFKRPDLLYLEPLGTKQLSKVRLQEGDALYDVIICVLKGTRKGTIQNSQNTNKKAANIGKNVICEAFPVSLISIGWILLDYLKGEFRETNVSKRNQNV